MTEDPMAGPVINVKITYCDDDWLMSSEAMALLCGVPYNEVRRRAANFELNDPDDLPPGWTQKSHRRLREAQAACQITDIRDALQYLAARYHDAVINFIYDDRTTQDDNA